MHRPTIIFLLSHKLTTVQQKTTNRKINHIKQSEKTIQNLSINNTLKTKHNKKHDKLSQQSIVKSITQTIMTNSSHNLSIKNTQKQTQQKQLRKNTMLLNIKISQTATPSEPTTNTLFIKTQRKYTSQPGQLLFGTRYNKHEKAKLIIFR